MPITIAMESSQVTIEHYLYGFWGKADRENPVKMLPAVFHMLDVALVAEKIIAGLPESERQLLLSPFSQCKEPVKVLIWLIALHDIGKLTPGFQYKLRAYLKFDCALYPEGTVNESHHGVSSMAIIRRILELSLLGLSTEAIKTLATFSASHHGRYEWGAYFSKKTKARYGDQKWQELQQTAADWLMKQFNLSWESIKIDESRLTKEWLVYAAGLCAVSDWIGSDQSIFNYDRTNYKIFKEQLPRLIGEAQNRLSELKIKRGLFAQSIFEFSLSYRFSPNPLQQACLDLVSSKQCPDLVIIEAPMGEGKTEAAQILSHHLAREKGCAGIYLAMPSQASSNQLYRRMLAFIRSLEGLDQTIETHLLHTNAELNPDYQGLKTSSVCEEKELGGEKGFEGSLSADQWFSGRKKGLLSTCAVGTIDQILMAGMRVKHHFVRLFGLANKVVVLDEVHALDSYQKELLKNLLAWLSRLGSPVIMLSATLPETMKKELVAAYFNTNNHEVPEVQYPRLSLFETDKNPVVHSIRSVGDGAKSRYRIQLSECHHTSLVDKMTSNVLADLQQAGRGIIVCIVNTVGRAQSLFRELKKRLDESDFNDVKIILAHARFPIFKRIEIEQKIEQYLGVNKDDRNAINPKRPSKMILVGTQVLEQSLDYSGDKLHTELCPMDLLLQRLGRIHRHKVNSQAMSDYFREPTCEVYLPENLDDLRSGAEGTFGFANAAIYPPSILLKTSLLLQLKATANRVELELPAGIDSFVQETYRDEFKLSDEGEDWDLLDTLSNIRETIIAKDKIFSPGVESVGELIGQTSNDELDDNFDMSTRLALPNITLVLLKKTSGGEWQTLNNNTVEIAEKFSTSTLKALKESSLTISNQNWVRYFSSDSYYSDFWQQERVKTLWGKTSLLYKCVPVCLDHNNEYCAPQLGKLWWDEQLGLCW